MASDHLYELIQSLDKAEKSHFKKVSGAERKNSNYLSLFEAIARQKNYDEQALKRKFAGEAFVKQFPVAKHYLYNLLLKSMESYQPDRKAELQSIIQRVNFLVRKTLYDQALKWIAKGKKLAREQEAQLYFLELDDLEVFVLMVSNRFTLGTGESFDRTEGLAAADAAKNRLELDDLKYRMHFSQFLPTLEERKAAMTALWQHPLFQAEDGAQSELARHALHFASAYYHLTHDDVKASKEHTARMLAVVEANPHLFPDGARLISNYSFHIQRCTACGEEEEALLYLSKMRALPVDDKASRARIFYLSYFCEYNLYHFTRNAEAGVARLPDFEREEAEYGAITGQGKLLHIYYMISHCLALSGDYALARRWLQKVLHDQAPQVAYGLQGAARLMELILLFELDDLDWLEHRLRSTYRFFKQHYHEKGIETLALTHFRRMATARDEASLHANFKTLIDALEEAKEAHALADLFDYLDLSAWLRYRIGITTKWEG